MSPNFKLYRTKDILVVIMVVLWVLPSLAPFEARQFIRKNCQTLSSPVHWNCVHESLWHTAVKYWATRKSLGSNLSTCTLKALYQHMNNENSNTGNMCCLLLYSKKYPFFIKGYFYSLYHGTIPFTFKNGKRITIKCQ